MALLFSDALFSRAEQPVVKKRSSADDLLPAKIEKSEDILNISINVSTFKQRELEVKIVGEFIEVEAHHSIAGRGPAERHFIQKFKIPSLMDRNSMQITFDGKGNMLIAARAKSCAPSPPVKTGRRKISMMTK